MTTSIISGSKMSSFTTCLLFFVFVGIVRTQDFTFPSDDGYYNSYPTWRNNNGHVSAESSANVDHYGHTDAKSNANTQGNDGWADSWSNAENNPHGGSAEAGSKSGTGNRYDNSGSEASAKTYVDEYGNAHAKSESHAHSGSGGSSAASASAAAGINKFGQPVVATGTAGSSAGPNGLSSAMSAATAIGGNNHPNNQGYYNYPRNIMPYPWRHNQYSFGYRSGVDDADDDANDDSKAQPQPKLYH
ncbi:GSCOCG00007509001-RA-CDS [Cotesia congregata]|uniref:Uncharacterized protein n=1 Tax=Cotesia congregata TaxID=51543 RepID=A0A8J2HPI7_COTCN|nr:GSCOCG00007509001-RA-CDS [Cotesia congregata]CAG5101583.1 Protein of unknown function [Cotesia congregata]